MDAPDNGLAFRYHRKKGGDSSINNTQREKMSVGAGYTAESPVGAERQPHYQPHYARLPIGSILHGGPCFTLCVVCSPFTKTIVHRCAKE